MSSQAFVNISAKLKKGADDDLINLWANMPKNQRSATLRDALRKNANLPAKGGVFDQYAPAPVQLSFLEEVVENQRWLRREMNAMPEYLENLMQRMAWTGAAVPPPPPEPEVTVDQATLDLRKQNAKKAKW